MTNYRLKKEAVPFFQEKFATAIYPFDTWQQKGIDIVALDEVEEMYINYGISTSKNSSSLSGWDGKGEGEGSHFHFTIKFPSMKFREHDEFSNGKIVRGLMDKIQQQLNYFYQDFVNKEKE